MHFAENGTEKYDFLIPLKNTKVFYYGLHGHSNHTDCLLVIYYAKGKSMLFHGDTIKTLNAIGKKNFIGISVNIYFYLKYSLHPAMSVVN